MDDAGKVQDPSEGVVRFPELRRGRRGRPSLGFESSNPSSQNPFSLMQRMTEEMDRMFAQYGLGKDAGQHTHYWSPAIEVSHSDGQLVIIAELPGVTVEDLRLEINAQGLILEGERKAGPEERPGGVIQSNRSHGYFYRVIPLPENVDADQAKATYRDGVLEVTIPIREPDRSQARYHGLPYATYLNKDRVLATIRETLKNPASPA
jgi:HSP20 family protein